MEQMHLFHYLHVQEQLLKYEVGIKRNFFKVIWNTEVTPLGAIWQQIR